jgi:uncharacterized membrane protein
MNKGRLEAFSDGVIAIIITIMILELRVPHGADAAVLRPMIPAFLSYVLSFVYLGIYWSNHHHLLQAARQVNGGILWANLHLLFWLSLVPMATGWMGDSGFAAVPVALYGVVLLLAAMAYTILCRALIAHHGRDSVLAGAVGRDFKGTISMVFYAVGILLSFASAPIACGLYVVVAIMWLVPDRRIERALAQQD